MGKLKSIQEQVQESFEKALAAVEEQHRALAAKPFELAEKLEEEAKTLSVKSLREMHDQAIDTLYASLREWNKKVNELASELIAKVEPEETAKESAQAPAEKAEAKPAEKAEAKSAAKAESKAAAKKEEATA
ncbi:hypothetical protein AAIA72_09965 [Hahella sp. SMD15-11]|uniref:Phasin family protein n=1 Tax=Thermohahella caldifontis TaxID=3142973 RepID=A0AB39UTJ2_9GAMM